MVHISTYKKFGTYLLLAVLLLQSFNRLFIVGDYYLHTASYAERCENKLRVELHCNGQCIIAKKLKEADKREKNSADKKIERYHDVYLALPTTLSLPPATYEDRQLTDFPELPVAVTSDYSPSVFRPPIG